VVSRELVEKSHHKYSVLLPTCIYLNAMQLFLHRGYAFINIAYAFILILTSLQVHIPFLLSTLEARFTTDHQIMDTKFIRTKSNAMRRPKVVDLIVGYFLVSKKKVYSYRIFPPQGPYLTRSFVCFRLNNQKSMEFPQYHSYTPKCASRNASLPLKPSTPIH
jgi:hypothetical protein